jgi:hypothetical protein
MPAIAEATMSGANDPTTATSRFRETYRAAVHPSYNPWLHGGFVLAYGLGCVGFFFHSVADVRAVEWLSVPAAVIVFNVVVYVVHRFLGHHKYPFARLFYARHTGDHHTFFTPGQMSYDNPRDWRVILFPPWLIVIHSVIALPGWWFLARYDPNVAGLFSGTMILGYLAYEIVHACEHLPDSNPITRLPWISQMRRLHALHHRHDLMRERNFNLVLPLADMLFGTLQWEAKPGRNAGEPCP